MSVNSLTASPYSATLSLLNSANKQPELALDLILQSVAKLPSDDKVKSPVTAVALSRSPSPVDGKGTLINTTA